MAEKRYMKDKRVEWHGTAAEFAASIEAFVPGDYYVVDNGDEYKRQSNNTWIQVKVNGAAHVTDSIALSGNARTTVALSTTAAVSAALAGGVYDVWCDADCYLRVATSTLHTSTPVTTAIGYLLRAGNTVPLIIPDQERIGGIVSVGTATLSYHKVN